MKFLQFPVFSILIGLIIGILVSFYQQMIPLSPIFLAIPTGIAFLGFVFYTHCKNYLILFCLAWTACIGLYVGSNYFQQDEPSEIILAKQKPVAIAGYVYKKLPTNLYNHSYYFQITSINHQAFHRRVLFQISKKNLSEKPPENFTKLHIYSTIEDIPFKGNLHGFNYQNYLKQRGLKHQINLMQPIFNEVGQHKNLVYYDYWLQQQLEKKINQFELSNFSRSLYKALLLGDKSEVDKETYQKFSSSGAIHLLAISGLHIAIILIFLHALFLPLQRIDRWRPWVPLMIILILWIFAFLTGMSPSVMRAVTMFSFITYSLYQQTQLSIYHHLAASMVILLMIYPSFLFEVGFQLSYLAVIFIVWTQPLFQKWEPKNPITKYFYGIVTVSIGAQLGVLPLSLFYFHQIPGMFLVTNLFAIPTVTLLLFLGISILLLDTLHLSTSWLVDVFDKLSLGMLRGIDQVSSVEILLWKNIPMETELLFLSYLTLFFLVHLLHHYKSWKLWGISISMLLFHYFYQEKNWNENSQEYFIVFNQRKENLMMHRKQSKLTAYTNIQDTLNNKTIQNYMRGSYAKQIHYKPIQNFYEINHKKILWISESILPTIPIKPDIVILSNNAKVNLEVLIISYQPEKIIADGTNYKATIKRWQKTCSNYQISFASTYDQGFEIIR
ncbi:MAG: ComEC/Rec2 family competence protein [Flavobacterium sp.]